MLSLHDQGRGPWILLHVVSGPWTSLVALHDKGQCKIAVCGRHMGYYYTQIELIIQVILEVVYTLLAKNEA